MRGDELRKDPDEEFEWRDKRTTEAMNLLYKLCEDEDISHDDFLECISGVTEKLRKCLWGVRMDKILEKLPKVHTNILKDLRYKMCNEKDKEMAIRTGCFFRGYVNCLRQQNLLTDDELWELYHHSITEDDFAK